MCVREITRQFLFNRKEKQYAFYNLPDTRTDFMPSRDADAWTSWTENKNGSRQKSESRFSLPKNQLLLKLYIKMYRQHRR